MSTRLLVVFFCVCISTANGQTIMSLTYFDTSKLSVGYQSNRIVAINANKAGVNLQLQSSVLNDRLANQVMNVALRYNFGNQETRVSPLISIENSYAFKNPVVRSGIELQYKQGILTAAVLTAWDFDKHDFLYQAAMNFKILRKFSVQSSYGNYKPELFGAEQLFQNGVVISSSPVSLRFLSALPIENGTVQYKYNRFITTFLITILNKS